jgi:hypothetical protein
VKQFASFCFLTRVSLFMQATAYDHSAYGNYNQQQQQQPTMKDYQYQSSTSKYTGGASHSSQAHTAYSTSGQASGFGANIASASTSAPLAAAAQQQVSICAGLTYVHPCRWEKFVGISFVLDLASAREFSASKWGSHP